MGSGVSINIPEELTVDQFHVLTNQFFDTYKDDKEKISKQNFLKIKDILSNLYENSTENDINKDNNLKVKFEERSKQRRKSLGGEISKKVDEISKIRPSITNIITDKKNDDEKTEDKNTEKITSAPKITEGRKKRNRSLTSTDGLRKLSLKIEEDETIPSYGGILRPSPTLSTSTKGITTSKSTPQDLIPPELKADYKGIRHVKMNLLHDVLRVVWGEGKTPLLLDGTGHIETFFQCHQYGMICLDAKSLYKKTQVTKIQCITDALIEWHFKLLQALKEGLWFIVMMGNGTTNFNTLFTSPLLFPAKDVFQHGSASTIYQSLEPNLQIEDKFVPNADFRVVITSKQSIDEVHKQLGPSLPMQQLALVVLDTSRD